MVITIIIPCYRSENTLEFVVNEIKDEIGYKNIYMGWNKEGYISKSADEFKDYIIENINQW